jgi:hypothetical protein
VGDDVATSSYLPYAAPFRATPSDIGHTDIPPERQQQDLGQVISFKHMNNETDVILKTWMVIRWAQLAAGGGGANPRYPDDPNNHALEYLEILSGGRELQSIYGDDNHFKPIMEKTPDEMAKTYTQRHDLLPLAARAAEAATVGGFSVVSDLPLWYEEGTRNCLHQYVTDAPLRYKAFMRPAANVVQQTGGTIPTAVGGNYIVDIFLRHRILATFQGEKDAHIDMLNRMGEEGILYKMRDIQRVSDWPVPVGTTTMTINIENFTKHTPRWYFILRPSANLAADFTNNNRWALTPLTRRRVVADGKVLASDHCHEFLINTENADHLLGSAAHNIYNIFHNEAADDHQNCQPGVDYSLLSVPRLIIEFAVGLANAHTLDAFSYAHNFVKEEKEGKQVKYSKLYRN